MPRTTKYLTFDGQFESRVLGTFRIIRGFASLKDLAEISVPYLMEDKPNDGDVQGQQRTINPEHAERIKHYLQSGERRFLPEVILSVRTTLEDTRNSSNKVIGVKTAGETNGIVIGRPWSSQHIQVHRVTIERKKLAEIREKKLIRRVDGNHRLALAEKLKDDPHLPTKYLAPFCMVLLGPASEEADDYSESLIFHTINSTALPLESEHALKLIFGQNPDFDMKPEVEFAFSPDLHFTRLLHDGLLRLAEPARARLGHKPLTSLRGAVRGLLEMDPSIAKDLPTLRTYSKHILAALSDIVTRLEPTQQTLCQAEYFIELAARVWKATPEGEAHNARVNAAVAYLEKLAVWLGKDGLTNIKESGSLSKQVLDIFNTVKSRIPKRVFLARWYPTASDGEELERAQLRLQQVKNTLKEVEKEEGANLELVDMGTQTGGTFPIHAKMYAEISSADIILVDLTGVRPNVCVEAGFALRNHEKNRLIFLFQPIKNFKTVPFDLNTFRYEPFNDTGEIPGKLKPHIAAILKGAAIGS